jgi:ribosomal protein S18 acetylase RimI-like enzyme
MELADLRRIQSRQLDEVFSEEQRAWLEELHWDYRPSVELIKRFIDAKSLAGLAVTEAGRALGYGFYVTEETKALIGGLFISAAAAGERAEAAARMLLEEIIERLQSSGDLRRIESQLMPFGPRLDATLAARNFRLHMRQFMLLPLREAALSGAPVPPGLRLAAWDDGHFEACARLIASAYAGHVDSAINDQYQSRSGAMKFLKNIVILPGCGRFQPEASFVVHAGEKYRAGNELAAAVLASEVSKGVGHITQICVQPQHRGMGLGLRLMESSIQAMKSRRFHALSLTVTRANAGAVRLYERIGFRTVKSFPAAVWQNPALSL